MSLYQQLKGIYVAVDNLPDNVGITGLVRVILHMIAIGDSLGDVNAKLTMPPPGVIHKRVLNIKSSPFWERLQIIIYETVTVFCRLLNPADKIHVTIYSPAATYRLINPNVV
jgi:hypothetical protein